MNRANDGITEGQVKGHGDDTVHDGYSDVDVVKVRTAAAVRMIVGSPADATGATTR
jgi:hypothetical protein